MTMNCVTLEMASITYKKINGYVYFLIEFN